MQAQASSEPVELIKSNSSQILDILHKDSGRSNQVAQKKIEAIAVPHFDFQRMTALAVGPDWNKANTSQKEQLSEAFQNLLVRVYGKTMVRFRDAELNINETPLIQDGGKRATVKSVVTFQGGQKNAKIDYVLIKNDRGWKVIDVRVEGGSLVTVYRNQFAQKIQESGIDGLIDYLESKNK
jgi:phospholipid transport system substrate-binding protein